MRFAPDLLAGFRRGVLRRGQVLATILSELLAGKDKTRAIDALGLHARPGMRPEEMVRAALDAVEARRRMIDGDDDRFGRCDVCAEDLGPIALAEMPWADRCQKHLGD